MGRSACDSSALKCYCLERANQPAQLFSMGALQGEFNLWLLFCSCEQDVYCYLSQERRDGPSLLVVVHTALLWLVSVCSCGREDPRMALQHLFMTALRSERFFLGWTYFTCRVEAGNSRPPVEHLHRECLAIPVYQWTVTFTTSVVGVVMVTATTTVFTS